MASFESEQGAFVNLIIDAESDLLFEQFEMAGQVQVQSDSLVFVLHALVWFVEILVFGFLDSLLIKERILKCPTGLHVINP